MPTQEKVLVGTWVSWGNYVGAVGLAKVGVGCRVLVQIGQGGAAY